MYEVDEVAGLSGLSPSTVRAYCRPGATTLVRGRDFTVLRRYLFGRAQQKLVFTRRGLDRLTTHDYLRIHPANRKVKPAAAAIIARMAQEAAAARPGSPRSVEGRMRRRQSRIIALAQFLEANPCHVQKCSCACHAVAGRIY
jgi:hypothetical protein